MSFWFTPQPVMERAKVRMPPEPLSTTLTLPHAITRAALIVQPSGLLMRSAGPNAPLLVELAKASQDHKLRITYAGGIATQAHIEDTKRAGAGVVDFTIGTALSIFGGNLSLDEVLSACD